MKIEKLTENKIRIILKQDDFDGKTSNIYNLLSKSTNTHSLLLDILNRAEREIGFVTDGHKLLIESSFSNEDTFIFTITKYLDVNNSYFKKFDNKKYFITKKNIQNLNCFTYAFNNFDMFCNFVDTVKNINLNGLFKSSILYFYNDTYYLVIKNINSSHKYFNKFCLCTSEFSDFLCYSKSFESKLLEYGKIVIKSNAISTCIKYFCK